MAFDLTVVKEEIGVLLVESPLSRALAVAVVSDCVRIADRYPPPLAEWDRILAITTGVKGAPRREDQLAMLAQLLMTSTSLKTATVEAMNALLSRDPKDCPLEAAVRLDDLFARIAPITPEMMRANVFRQEETLRRWAEAWAGAIAGETPEESAARLDQLDYKKTMVEYQKAAKTREEQAAARKAALEEAEKADAAARAWRE
jgi:hypothetical protein